MPDPYDILADQLTGVGVTTQDPTAATTVSASSYGPIYDPNQLLQAGIDPILVNAYRNAATAYGQARDAATSQGGMFPNPALNTSMAQSASILRDIEKQITAYYKPPSAPRPSTITRGDSLYEYQFGTDEAPGTVKRIATFPGEEDKGTSFVDKYGNRYRQDPAQTYPGSYEPAQRPPAQMTWENPNAGLMREQDEADLDYRRRLTANVGVSEANANARALAQLEETQKQNAWSQWWQPEELQRRLQSQQEELQQRLQAQREQSAQDAKDAMARQRMQTQASLTNTFGNQWLQASQYAMNPAWGGVPPGFGADGPYGQLLRMGGSNPQSVQLPQMNFDPLNAWRMAQDALGG